MRIIVLGSGSKGNSLVVELGTTRVAVDAGFGTKTLARRMRAVGIAPQSISACAITHEHLDHAQGALRARDKWQWTIAATPPTLEAMGVVKPHERVQPLPYGESTCVGDIRITLIEVSHDAAAPAAVLIEDTRSGGRVGIAQDLGEIPERLADAFANLDMLVLEANHDAVMLKCGPYPPFLQERVAGARGHLSNAQSAAFARRMAHPGLRAIVLAHLSQQNNTAAIARSAVARGLAGTRFKGLLGTASQTTPCSVGKAPELQLNLL